MMVKLYVTRWVLARGILVMTAQLVTRKGARGSQKDWYSLETGKWDRYRRHRVCLGRDAFLKLQEAQEAAHLAFEAAAQDTDERARALRRAVQRIGHLQVHDLTDATTSISGLHAFK